ncbi:23S rRNA (guanosine(2251)-2'-O)-methyltransferase RlmB [Pseudomonadota bacterium]
MSKSYLCGFHAVDALVNTKPKRISQIWFDPERSDRRAEKLIESVRAKGIHMAYKTKKELDEMANGVRHQGVIAECRPISLRPENELEQFLDSITETPLLLVLDGVTDPHNFGASLRCADGAGVHAVIVPRDKSCGLTPVVHRVASGATQVLPIFEVKNLVRCLDNLKKNGFWVTGAAEQASTNLYQADFKGPTIVIVGAEGRGMRRLTEETCDRLVYIPMRGSVASLNVSVATGILLFEAQRQRSQI